MILKNDRYVLAVSYHNYCTGNGGTDKAILEHEKLFKQVCVSLLYLFPYGVVGKAKALKRFHLWGVIADGSLIGYFTTNQVLEILGNLEKHQTRLLKIYLHHLKDVPLESLHKILNGTDAPVCMLLHDYHTVCPGSGLVKNGVCYCGPDAPGADKCKECEGFGSERLARLAAVQGFFEALGERISFMAPSDAAKKVWIYTYPQYQDRVEVIYHQQWQEKYFGNLHEVDPKEPLKIAFVGYQRELKGWPAWQRAVQMAYEAGKNMKFYQFGQTETSYPYIEEVKIDFKQNLDAMTIALRQRGIHCAVLWSMWPETYSYTYYEAWAANAFVLTNDLSGNICAQVLANGNGFIARSNQTLADLLLDEDSLRLSVNAYRKQQQGGPLTLEQNVALLDTLPDKPSIIKGRPIVNPLERVAMDLLNMVKRH